MSTHIATIKGRVEEVHTQQKATYIEADLSLVRFYGGKKKGRMLQLTTSGNEGYIQLTREQVKNLAVILLNSFEDDIYPSE